MKKKLQAWGLCLVFAASVLFSGATVVSAVEPEVTVKALLNSTPLHPQKTGYAVIDDKVEALLAEFRSEGADDTYSLVKACYDWLIDHVSYGFSGQSVPDLDKPFGYVSDVPYKTASYSWNALFQNTGTCVNYSAAFLIMVRAIGLDAYSYEGQTSRQGGGYVEHTWTEITIHGANYIFDAQVEDDVAGRLGETQYLYFCKTEQEMQNRYLWENTDQIQERRRDFGASNRLAKADPSLIAADTAQFQSIVNTKGSGVFGKNIYFSQTISKEAVASIIESKFPGYSYRFVPASYESPIADSVNIGYPEFVSGVTQRLNLGESGEICVENLPDGVTVQTVLSDSSVASIQDITVGSNRKVFSVKALKKGNATLTITASDGYSKVIDISIAADKIALDSYEGALFAGLSTYDFTVENVYDASQITVRSDDASVANAAVVGVTDQGVQYRVTSTGKTGSTRIAVTYQGNTVYFAAFVYSADGSIMLDTANYIMAPGNQYTIGVTIKDANGNRLSSEQVRHLVESGELIVRDSRTGSIVDLKQLSNGNFQVTAKYEGSGYILYEINGTHASVRIDVKNGVEQHGTAVRNTSYWNRNLRDSKK